MKILFIYLSKLPHNLTMLRPAPLTYPLLAAYTPPDVEISIVDESFENIDFDSEVDLVAMTFVVPLAPRAYEVAFEFRKRGRKVACGGPHATLMPEEAALHFDCVTLGQGDVVWPQIVEDFKRQDLKKFYAASKSVDITRVPFARRDLLNPSGYGILNTFQATRGCPFSCSFCTTRSIYPNFTAMPVRRVVEEIEQIQGNSLQRRVLIFWDDNLIGDPVWAMTLFREMTPLKKIWMGQCTFTIAHNDDLVKAASRSGCRGLFLGIESLNQKSLKNARKEHNLVRRYKDGIRRLHDNGIFVYAGIMFGFDDDTKDIFEITLDWMLDLGIDYAAPNIVVPYPNTGVFWRLRKERRIIHEDWSKYNGQHAVFYPRNMTAEELEEGRRWFSDQFLSYKSIFKRLWRSRTASWITLPINLGPKLFD